jgi:hypothetical protein
MLVDITSNTFCKCTATFRTHCIISMYILLCVIIRALLLYKCMYADRSPLHTAGVKLCMYCPLTWRFSNTVTLTGRRLGLSSLHSMESGKALYPTCPELHLTIIGHRPPVHCNCMLSILIINHTTVRSYTRTIDFLTGFIDNISGFQMTMAEPC